MGADGDDGDDRPGADAEGSGSDRAAPLAGLGEGPNGHGLVVTAYAAGVIDQRAAEIAKAKGGEPAASILNLGASPADGDRYALMEAVVEAQFGNLPLAGGRLGDHDFNKLEATVPVPTASRSASATDGPRDPRGPAIPGMTPAHRAAAWPPPAAASAYATKAEPADLAAPADGDRGVPGGADGRRDDGFRSYDEPGLHRGASEPTDPFAGDPQVEREFAALGDRPRVPPRTPITVRFTGRASFADPEVVDRARANIEPLLTAVEHRLADPDLDEYTVGQLERYRDTARHELYELDEADPVIVNQCVAKLAELVLPTGDWFAELPGVLEAAGVAPELAEATAEDLARAAELAVRTGGQSDADAARTADELGAVVDDLSNDVEVAGAEPGPDAGRRLVVLLKKAGSGVEKVGAVGGGVTLIFGVVKLVLGLFGVHLPFP